MLDLTGKTAVVTGGTKGIGKSIVVELLKSGARVFALGRTIINKSEFLENDLNLSDKLELIVCDISSSESISKASEEILSMTEKVDILVNNAGITKDNLILRMTEKDWDDVINTNLKGTFLITKAFIKNMVSNRSGRIINIGSIVGTTGNAGQSNYSASKAALIGFTKSLAKELGSRNICVNLIAPGYIQTDMTSKLNEEQLKTFTDNIPLKRVGQTTDIAKVVLFFSSDLASYITGQSIHVDGGLAI